jgi:hypothetical protein
MLAVLSWLKTHRRHAEISLICSGNEDNTSKLYGLSELNDEQLLALFENKETLSQDDIEYADYVWQLYCSDNPIRLENLTDFDNYRFKYLSEALIAHLKRFPTIKNGLNEQENQLLELAITEKPKSRAELLGAMLNNQGRYGFGDTQYDRILGSLKPLFSSFDPVRLTRKGKQILDGKANYYSHLRDNESYLGGALKYSFLYNTTSGRILKL